MSTVQVTVVYVEDSEFTDTNEIKKRKAEGPAIRCIETAC